MGSAVDETVELGIRFLQLVILMQNRLFRIVMNIHEEVHDGDTAEKRHQKVDRIAELKVFLGIDPLFDKIKIDPIGNQEQTHRKRNEQKCEISVLEPQQGKGHETADGKEHEHPAPKRIDDGKIENE